MVRRPRTYTWVSRDYRCSAAWRALRLESKDETKATIDGTHGVWRQSTLVLRQDHLVHRDDLRHVCNGVAWQSRFLGANKHISRRIGQFEVGREDDRHNRLESAPGEHVCLHHHDRPAVAGLCPLRLRQIGPPDRPAHDRRWPSLWCSHWSVASSALRSQVWFTTYRGPGPATGREQCAGPARSRASRTRYSGAP